MDDNRMVSGLIGGAVVAGSLFGAIAFGPIGLLGAPLVYILTVPGNRLNIKPISFLVGATVMSAAFATVNAIDPFIKKEAELTPTLTDAQKSGLRDNFKGPVTLVEEFKGACATVKLQGPVQSLPKGCSVKITPDL